MITTQMKKAGEILFISSLVMIITENTMNDHSKVILAFQN